MVKKFLTSLVLLCATQLSLADTPPARAINAQLYDAAANGITSTNEGGGVRGLDTHVTNLQGAPVWTRLTDGVSSPAIKPASTAPTVSDPSLVVAISPNSPISVTAMPPVNSAVTGTITAACPTGFGCAAGSTVQITTDGYTTLGFETHGTWSAAITQDVSFDPLCSSSPGTVMWYQTASVDTATNESFYVTTWGASKNDDPWVMNIASAFCARLRAVSYTSGTVEVTLTTGVGVATTWAISVGNVASGSADAGNPIKVGGKHNVTPPTLVDGDRGDLQLDSNARLVVAPLTNSSVIKSQLQDNAGNGLSSQVNGSQRALDVGINVAGVQVDPRTRTWNLSSGSDNVSAVQSGTWTVQQGGAPWSVGGNVASGSADSGNPVKVGGIYNTVFPTLTNGQRGDMQLDSSARLIVAPLTNSSVVKAQLQDNSGTAITLGQKAMTSSIPVVVASDQSAFPVSQSGAPWSVAGNVASGATDSGNPVKIGGVYNTTLPTFTNGQRGDFQIGARGGLIVTGGSPDGATPLQNAVHIGGVDTGGLKRTLLMDTSGRATTTQNSTYTRINTATTTTVKSGTGILYAICFNTGVNNATVTIYDNTTATAPIIGVVTQRVGGGADTPKGCSNYGGMVFNTGLTIVTSAAVDITVLYR